MVEVIAEVQRKDSDDEEYTNNILISAEGKNDFLVWKDELFDIDPWVASEISPTSEKADVGKYAETQAKALMFVFRQIGIVD